jgi:tetrahydromethanopterin S-methyltransferase subunit B
MRRAVFLTMGLLELGIAAALVLLGSCLPTTDAVERTFGSAGRVTDRAGVQVRLLRQQVQGLQRLELRQLAGRLRTQTRAVTTLLRSQQVDFETVATLRDAMGDVATGLVSLAETLDPDTIGKLSTGLSEMASFLDEKVVPSAALAADHLEESTEALRADARRLCALLRNAPPDLRAVREVHDSLAHFGEGLAKMNGLIKVQRLDAMRDGFRGLETSLSTGAEQVSRLSDYTYPVLTFNGVRLELSQRPFWPQGREIAEGMHKAATGVQAAGKEMDDMAADLPALRTSLTESAKVVVKTREALALALKQQDKVEPLLKDVPEHAARLVEELPKLGGDLARILRDTRRLKEVAAALRQANKGIDNAVARWPELRITLTRFATTLQVTHGQLDQALQHREEYETAMKQSILLGDSFAELLPLVTDQIDNRLEEEEQALDELGQSLDEVKGALPAYASTTSHLLQAGRLLAWLVALIVGLHGCYLMLSVRLGRRYSI